MTEENREENTEQLGGQEISEDDQEIDQGPELTQDEERATKHGWRPKEDWGGDSDEWVSAKKFNERGDMIGKIRSLENRFTDRETDFKSRLDHQKKLHEAQLKVTISDLESKRNDAIDDADRNKANNIQDQIDQVKSSIEPVDDTNNKNDSVLDGWNSRNPWIYDSSPKSAYAISRYNLHLQSGKGTSDAISMMESEVSQHFPDVNSRRDKAQSVEGGRSKPKYKSSPKLAWSQLTAEELKWYNAMPSAWPSKDDYIKAAMDNRN